MHDFQSESRLLVLFYCMKELTLLEKVGFESINIGIW